MRSLLASCALLLAVVGCNPEAADVVSPTPAADDGGTSGGDATAADANDAGATPADAGAPPQPSPPADAGSRPLVGTRIAPGLGLYVEGITTEGMIVYTDATNYYAVPLSGGAPTQLVPIANGAEKVAVEGPYAFFWSTTSNLAVASGCPFCEGPFSLWQDAGLTPDQPPVVSADGYIAVTTHGPNGESLSIVTDPPTMVLQDAPCIQSVQFMPNDDLVVTYCAVGDQGEPLTFTGVFAWTGVPQEPVEDLVAWPGGPDASAPAGALAPNGAWLLTVPSGGAAPDGGGSVLTSLTSLASPESIVTHVLPAAPSAAAFDGTSANLYVSGSAIGLERISLPDLGTTTLSTAFCSGPMAVSPDGGAVFCGNLISTQTGVVTDLPLPVTGFTDDWSYVYGTSMGLPEDGGYVSSAWVSPSGAFAPTVLGTNGVGAVDLTPLSDTTLLVQSGDELTIVDATGTTAPIVVSPSAQRNVPGFAPGFALTADRKVIVYATSDGALPGIYAVAVP